MSDLVLRRVRQIRVYRGAAGQRGALPGPRYAGLAAGEYIIWDEQHRPAASVVIAGGQVTSCRWPAG
jgi:hypothetical protein